MWRCRWTRSCPSIPRRFLHTRWSRNRYFDDIRGFENIIEDPELDALDGGLSPLRGETDREETTGSRWRSSWIIPTCPALREPPSAQGCICVRRYPVCRERCGQPVQRRGCSALPAAAKHQEASRNGSTEKLPGNSAAARTVSSPCQRQDLCHPRRKPYRDF